MKEREYCKNWRRMFGHTDTIGLEMNAFRAFGRKSIIYVYIYTNVIISHIYYKKI